jgi:hypothetical protein
MPAEFPLNRDGSLDLATLDSISSDILKQKVVRVIASSIQASVFLSAFWFLIFDSASRRSLDDLGGLHAMLRHRICRE